MNKIENSISAKQGKSKFVTYFAWMFIVSAGLGTFMAIIQNIMFFVFFPAKEIRQILNSSEAAQYIPAILPFIISHIRFFLLVYLLAAGVTFIASIGLLMRKNWARIFFVSIMSLAIIWNLVEMFFYGALIPKIPVFPDEIGLPNFQVILSEIRIFAVVIAIGLMIFYAWIVKKLVSKNIKQEFLSIT
ncbi:MAG: DUF2127 domain-containing protein [Candidatus Ratteibacteria bacterium]|nr:DUF2127 domain-containing protein [Candidatus Ratteibacteria bacterium]